MKSFQSVILYILIYCCIPHHVSLTINTHHAVAICSKHVSRTPAGRQGCRSEEWYDSTYNECVSVSFIFILAVKLHNFRQYLQSAHNLYCHPKAHTEIDAKFVYFLAKIRSITTSTNKDIDVDATLLSTSSNCV